MKNLSGKDLEIGKSISEWLLNLGFNETLETFLKESLIKQEEIPKSKVLDKKWTTILTMQKKINDLENKIKTMKEEFESASISGVSYNQSNEKTNMVYFFYNII